MAATFTKTPAWETKGYDAAAKTQALDVYESVRFLFSDPNGTVGDYTFRVSDENLVDLTEVPMSDETKERLVDVYGVAPGTLTLEALNTSSSQVDKVDFTVSKTPAGPLQSGPASGTPSGGQPNGNSVAVPSGVLTTNIWPDKIRSDVLVDDWKLQWSLDSSIAKHHSASWAVSVAIADLDPMHGGKHPSAHHRGDETHFTASTGKAIVMYAAFQFRLVARKLYSELGGALDKTEFVKRMAEYMDPQIKSTVANTLSSLKGIKDVHALPLYGKMFDVVLGADKKTRTVEFSSSMKGNISMMIRHSDNSGTANTVHGCGYGYLNGVLALAGFFDPDANYNAALDLSGSGLWIAGDYLGGGQYPAFRIPCVNDVSTAQGATSRMLVRMMTLINDDELVGAKACAEMRTLLTRTVRRSHVWIDRSSKINFTVTHNKLGDDRLNAPNVGVTFSEVTMLKHNDSGRRFAVAWQNYREHDSFDGIANVVSDTITQYLNPVQTVP